MAPILAKYEEEGSPYYSSARYDHTRLSLSQGSLSINMLALSVLSRDHWHSEKAKSIPVLN